MTITATNTGDDLTAAHTGELFEAFRRRRGRTGTRGLGLTPVRAIARSHGGTAGAAPNPGGGLTVTVRLPEAAGPGRG